MTIPIFDEETIRANCTADSFRKGKDYFDDGVVISIVRRGDQISAEVQGSGYDPYVVTVGLVDGEILDAACTCPYDWGGWCKHIVAALLAYGEDPQMVEERQPLSALLVDLDADQLRALIEKLADKWPDSVPFLEGWIAAGVGSQPATTPSTATATPVVLTVDLATIRRQVQALARRGVDGIDDYLTQVVQLLESDQGQDALAVLEAVSEELIDSIDEEESYFSSGRYRGYYYDDDAGSEYYTLLEAMGVLWAEVLLSVDLPPEERAEYQELLSSWDEELGAVDWLGADDFFSVGVAALEYDWDYPPLQRAMAGEITESGAWEGDAPYHADDLAVIRLRVLERQGRLQEYLHLAEAEGQTALYINMLAKVGRTDEAVSAALQHLHQVTDAHRVARSLHSAGEIAAALQVAEHGLSLENYGKHDLAVWLRETAAEAGNLEVTLRAGSVAVLAQNLLSDYTRLQQLAGDEWPALQEDILAQLRQKGATFGTNTVDIFLHEGLIDDAIAAIGPHSYETKVIAVMEAATQSHPQWVIQAAQSRAESIMNAGKADRYVDAVAWLRRAKEAYVTSGQQSAWTGYLTQIRGKHGRKWKLMGLLKGI